MIKYHPREVVERVLALWYWSFSSRNVIRFWSHEKMLDGSFGREIVDCIWGLIYKGREDCLHFIWHVIYKCPCSRWNWKHKSGQCQTKHLPSSSWKLWKTLESQCQKGQGWMAKAALSSTMFSAQNTVPVCLTWPLFLAGELSGHLFYLAVAKILFVSRVKKDIPSQYVCLKGPFKCKSQLSIWCLLSVKGIWAQFLVHFRHKWFSLTSLIHSGGFADWLWTF